MAAAVDEDEVLSAVMTSLAVAPLLDIASDMDLEDLIKSMEHLMIQFYHGSVSREAIEVPLLTFNRIDPTVIPLKTLTITFKDLWAMPELEHIKFLEKFVEIIPTFSSFRENLSFVTDVLSFLEVLIITVVEELNSFKADETVTEKTLTVHNYLIDLFYLTLNQEWEMLQKKWRSHIQALEPHLLYIIAAHSRLHTACSKNILKQIINTITKTYPKIDFNILLELGSQQRKEWTLDTKNGLIRSLLFEPEKHKDSIVESILKNLLLPKLKKGTWEDKLVPKNVYLWCLQHTKYPYVGLYLSELLPPALLFLDHTDSGSKKLALLSLHHILENTTQSEVKMCNHHHVIYDGLVTQLYTSEPEVLDALIPCLLVALSVIEDPPCKSTDLWVSSRYDTCLLKYLKQMEYESKFTFKRIFIKHLERFFPVMGVSIIKHLKVLITIIVEYLEFEDPIEEKTRFATFRCLNMLIQYAWPRIPNHSINLLMPIVKLISECHDKYTETKSDHSRRLINEAKDLLLLLKCCCKGTLDKHLECLKNVNNDGVKEMVKFVTENKLEL